MLFILTKSCFKTPRLVFANVNGLLSSIQTMKAKKNHTIVLAVEMGNERQEAER